MDSENDTNHDAKLHFRLDIQRCKAYIMTLTGVVDMCSYNGSDAKATLLAHILESTVDAINAVPIGL